MLKKVRQQIWEIWNRFWVILWLFLASEWSKTPNKKIRKPLACKKFCRYTWVNKAVLRSWLVDHQIVSKRTKHFFGDQLIGNWITLRKLGYAKSLQSFLEFTHKWLEVFSQLDFTNLKPIGFLIIQISIKESIETRICGYGYQYIVTLRTCTNAPLHKMNKRKGLFFYKRP